MDTGRRGRRTPLDPLPRRRAPATAQAAEAFYRAQMAKGFQPTTVSWYRTILERLAREQHLLPTTPEPLEALLAGLQHVGDETRFAYWRGLRTFYV